MEKIKENLEYAAALQKQLSADDLSTIDFDSLRQWLSDTSTILRRSEALAGEHSLLREDYTGRMAGMIKAIAVASRDEKALDTALEQIEYLKGCSSAELINGYRRVSSIFRDTFAASFPPVGNISFTGRSSGKN